MKADLEKFYTLIDQIEIAMMTTRRRDGHLESRAMANQKRATGADLWFVTAEATGKVGDLEVDPHVNLSYYKDRTREWISVSVSQRSRGTVRRSANCTRPTGRPGFPTKVMHATERRTTRAWC
jgi:hypothetical protein